jgi:hypothetical protein
MSDPIAEVIESSTRQFTAEVHRDANAPAFGTWVAVEHENGTVLYGLVSHVEHGSYETSRQPVALGKTKEELAQEYPQVQELLRTTFRAQVLACADAGGTIRQTLPPHPPDIHDFVRPCPPEEVQGLGAPYDYMRTLVQSPDPAVPVDDLLVAVLQQVRTAHGGEHGSEDALVEAGRALSRLLDDDHERLQSILRRVT